MCTNVKFEIFPALSFRKFETNPTLTDIRDFSIYMDSKQRQLWHSKFFRLSIRNFSALPILHILSDGVKKLILLLFYEGWSSRWKAISTQGLLLLMGQTQKRHELD